MLSAKVAQKPCVKLLVVYFKPVIALLDIRRCGKHKRTAHAEMREQHLTKLLVHRLIFSRIDKRQRNVLKAQPRHITATALFYAYRDKHRLWFNDSVTERPGYLISAAVRACAAVRRSARRYYDVIRINLALTEPYALDSAVLGYYPFCVRGDYFDAERTHALFKRFNNVLCTVGNRENTVSSLGFQRHSQPLKEAHGIICRKTRKSAV